MRLHPVALILAAVIATSSVPASANDGPSNRNSSHDDKVQLGPRPFFLVNDMDDSQLKRQLLACSDGPFKKSDFSIGHRGAALQFPEHTKESYEAAARLGAGIVSATSPSPKTSPWCAGTHKTICTRPPTFSSRRWPPNAQGPLPPQ